MTSKNNIEAIQYRVEFTFVNPKDTKHYKLKICASEAFYDVEQDYIRIEGQDSKVEYLTTSHHTNSDEYAIANDMTRPIFVAIYHTINKLMESKLLEKIKV